MDQLIKRVEHVFMYFRDRDYFKERLGITEYSIPDSAGHLAAISLTRKPFSNNKWSNLSLEEDDVFDFIEFLFDFVSKPGKLTTFVTETNYNYKDYEDFDENAAKTEFRAKVNLLLCDYRDGYELTELGEILTLGDAGLTDILQAEILPYDEENVDKCVRDAIRKWRNRHLDSAERKSAVRELADVFEWLKKTGRLATALTKHDESVLFDIVNNFHIRHHNPKQKSDYDENIWHSWMFHFYLATYHAVIRILLKHSNQPFT